MPAIGFVLTRREPFATADVYKVMGRDAMARAPTGGDRAPLVDDLTLARAMRRDEAAFRTIVARHESPVFALLGRILLCRQGQGLVEDLAQETFVRVYSGLPGFGRDGRWNLTGWILTIAARLALDELRRRPRQHEPLADAVEQADERQGADVEVERRRIAHAIGHAVEKLAPEYRAAFILREVHGFDYDAIAEALSIDLGTVKSRLSRARAALRAALAGLYDEK
jgi:RNA polymerase sigma-70 factor (ECF subfamily)